MYRKKLGKWWRNRAQFTDLCETNIEELSIRISHIEDVAYFSTILSFCFPRLISFSICQLEIRKPFVDQNYITLPSTCTSLHTASYLLPNFANCASLQSISLSGLSLFDKTFLRSLNLQPTVLRMYAQDTQISDDGFWNLIVNTVEGLPQLNVLRELFHSRNLFEKCEFVFISRTL